MTLTTVEDVKQESPVLSVDLIDQADALLEEGARGGCVRHGYRAWLAQSMWWEPKVRQVERAANASESKEEYGVVRCRMRKDKAMMWSLAIWGFPLWVSRFLPSDVCDQGYRYRVISYLATYWFFRQQGETELARELELQSRFGLKRPVQRLLFGAWSAMADRASKVFFMSALTLGLFFYALLMRVLAGGG